MPADLLRIVDAAMDEAARRAGAHLACRPGCDGCCRGPFPITALDAARLRDGLASLPAEVAEGILERARRSLARFGSQLPADAAEAPESFWDRHGDEPCPALDPASRTCLLYAFRPVSCRTYGPPVRIGSEDLPPCELCFTAATPAEVEACRVEPDPDGMEAAQLRGIEGGEVETVVARALAGAGPQPLPRLGRG